MAVLKSPLLWIAAVIFAAAGYFLVSLLAPEPKAAVAMVQVKVPDLSVDQLAGEKAFNARCADCHGVNAAGQAGVAPPLIHKIYEPSHHGDASFARAARLGAPAHHWPFGNMPPVDGITDGEIAAIVTYLRAVQRYNGIR